MTRLIRKLLLTSLLTVVLVSSGSVICYGQEILNTTVDKFSANHVQKDSETAKQLEIALIKLDAAEKREVLVNQRLAEKDIVIKAREDTISAKNEVIDLLKANRVDTNKIDTGDTRVLVRCDQQVAKAEERIKFLEHPPLLARLFNPDVIIAGVVGYGIGKVTSGGNQVQLTNPFTQFTQQFSNVGQGQFMMFQLTETDRMKQALKQMRTK
jgi:hypothetical protein